MHWARDDSIPGAALAMAIAGQRGRRAAWGT